MTKTQPTVLVVDDNRDMLVCIQMVLSSSYRVIGAENGEEGISQAMAVQPTVILSDLNMPGMMGDEMISEIRQQPALAKVPVIMITGRSDAAARSRITAANANDLLLKPFSVDELKEKVRYWVSHAA